MFQFLDIPRQQVFIPIIAIIQIARSVSAPEIFSVTISLEHQ